METSSDPYINIAFTNIEFNVNTTFRGADNGTDQRQTCPSSGEVATPTQEKCQHCVHINNFPVEIHSSSWPQICPKHRRRQHSVTECTSARMGNSVREINNSNSCTDDSANEETDDKSRYTATMNDIPQHLKNEDKDNHSKDDNTNEFFKYNSSENCLLGAMNDIPQHLKNEDKDNHSKDDNTNEFFKYNSSENCLLGAMNCVKDSQATNLLTNEVAKECSKPNEHDVVDEAPDQDANEFSHLNEKDIFQKLQDVGVMKECQVLDSLQEIHLSNVQVLEQVAKSEPAIKRLLGRHQLAAKDVKDVSVDEDIRSQVDTFLRTNVTGNLLVTRVLRENYSTFQSWLTAHLQVERNAGVARYKQALQMVDKQRRQRLKIAAILADVANTAQRLLQACNAALLAKPKKGFGESSCYAKTSMCKKCDSECGTGSLKQDCDIDTSTPACNNDYCCLMHNQCLKKICSPLRRCLDRSVSSSQIRNSTFKGDLVDNKTSTVKGTFWRQSKNRGQPRDGNQCHTRGSMTDSYVQEKNTGYKWSYHSRPDNKDTVCSRDHSMIRGTCDLGTDEETDWESRISDSLNGLSAVCDRLVSDHLACFRMMGLDPRLSLTEAVWVSLQHRCQNCGCNTPEMDIRLEALQQENMSLLNELKVLHSRLVDKNAELFNLQTRLERCEALLKDSSQTTVNKSDNRPSNGEIARTTKKSSFYSHKMCGDLAVSSHTSHSSTASLSPSTGFYPILQCSKITSSERTVPCNKITSIEKNTACSNITSNERTVVCNYTSSRTHPRFTDSEKDRIFSENSTRELTDKLEKLRMTEVGSEVINTDRAKTDMVQPIEKSAQVADKAKRTHPKRSTSSRVSNKTAGGEKKSWRHSLYVVQSSVNLKEGINHQISGVISPNSLRSAVQSDSPSVQKTSAVDGQSESLSAQNRPALDVQPAATWTLLSQIANIDSLTNTKHFTATIPAISESHKNQLGQTNSCTCNRRKLHKVHNLLHMSGRKDEEKDSNKLKEKCVLQANVVSLVSSLINDSTLILTRTGAPGKAAVSKCLRCQKLFNWADNHKLACSYHNEPFTSAEKFNQPGRVDQAFNQWRCCLQPENSQGCCFGQHI